MKFLFFILCLSSSLYAQTDPNAPLSPEVSKEPIITPAAPAETTTEVVEETIKEIPLQVSGTSFYRDNSKGTLLLGYQLLSTWIPFKWTGSYTYIHNKTWSWDFEFSRGKFGIGALGFDAASVTEKRYSLMARRYVGNSFHFIFGGYKNDFRAKIGDDILDDMSNTSIDDLKVSGYGVALGVGNRWQWRNGFTLGIDWFRMNIPLFNKKVDNEVLNNIDDNSDYRKVKHTLEKINDLPTVVILGLNAGYTF